MKRYLPLLLALTFVSPLAMRGAEQRVYLTGTPYVTIDGIYCGQVRTWSGGQPRGVVTSTGAKKQIASVVFDPVVMESGLPLDPPLNALFNEFAAGGTASRTLVLAHFDKGVAATGETLQANRAVLTKVEFSELRGDAKESTRAVLTFAVESTTVVPVFERTQGMASKVKASLTSNFRFALDGLPADRVAQVSALTLARQLSPGQATGEYRASLATAAVTVANFTLAISSVDVAPWLTWRDGFLRQGRNQDVNEKNGSITLLDPSMTKPIAVFKLSQVGLVRLDPNPHDADEKVSRFETELYVERVAAELITDRDSVPTPTPTPSPAAVANAEAAAARLADLRIKQAELEALELRRKTLVQAIATREAETASLKGNPNSAWEKTRLPVATRMLDDSKTSLVEVDGQLKTVREELAALQKTNDAIQVTAKKVPTIVPSAK